jgi:hypothetical protein
LAELLSEGGGLADGIKASYIHTYFPLLLFAGLELEKFLLSDRKGKNESLIMLLRKVCMYECTYVHMQLDDLSFPFPFPEHSFSYHIISISISIIMNNRALMLAPPSRLNSIQVRAKAVRY